jgi:hypothetical protein
MSAPSTREPQKIPISQATRGPNAVRFSSLFDILKKIGVAIVEYVEVVRDFQTAEARKLKLFAESLS